MDKQDDLSVYQIRGTSTSMLWRQVVPDHRESLMAAGSSQPSGKHVSLCRGKQALFLALLVVGVVGICILGFYRNVLLWRSGHAPVHGLRIGSSQETVVWHSTNTTGSTPLLLLTIFTTFKNDPRRFNIHSNVLRNWAQFMSHIQPILFNTHTNLKLTSLATRLGWLVVDSPRTSVHGVPYLREMYMSAQNLSRSVFYGYSNGDLLFDEGLCDTMAAVYRHLPELHRTMVIGRRTNFPIGSRTLFQAKEVSWLAKNKGELFRLDAEDYFFIAHNSFPWKTMPDLVIGRPAYDNYMVGHAIQEQVSVIDATLTLTALHQTGLDGNFAGHKNSDAGVNSRAIGHFNYGLGLTSSAQYLTMYSDLEVTVWARPPRKGAGHGLHQLTRAVTMPTIPTPFKSTTALHAGNKNMVMHTSKMNPSARKGNSLLERRNKVSNKGNGSPAWVSHTSVARGSLHSTTFAKPSQPGKPVQTSPSHSTVPNTTSPWHSEVSLIMEYLQQINGNHEDI